MESLVKTHTRHGVVYIELAHKPESRCFRFDDMDRAEWASLADLESANPKPRWYGHCMNKRDFTIL